MVILFSIPDTQLLNICDKHTKRLKEGYISSPNYPRTYPASKDCECEIKAPDNDHVFLSIYELTLEMADQVTCGDWLLVQSGSGKKRQSDLNCGHVMINAKNITSRSNEVMLHFHADENDNKTQRLKLQSEKQLKGFWLYFRCKTLLI